MTLATLLDEAERHAARLEVVAGEVKITAPAPLPADLLERLRGRKAELLALLGTNDSHPFPTGPCAYCGYLSWWADRSTWRCRRCSPPSDDNLAHCESYVANPSDPPQQPLIAAVPGPVQ